MGGVLLKANEIKVDPEKMIAELDLMRNATYIVKDGYTAFQIHQLALVNN